MPNNKTSNRGYTIIIIALLLTGAAVYFFRRKPVMAKNTIPVPAVTAPPATDTIPAPQSARRLPDGIHIYLLGNTKLAPRNDYPVHRELTLDGDAFFDVPAAASAFTIHTKLLTLTVPGDASFRVTGPAAEAWAEVDVVSGIVIARKAYSSPFNKPDTLHDGQMLMLNRTIDLSEAEEFDARTLKAWRDRLPR